ncbi:MAG: hypothetical protein NTZ18_05035 [Candidatus Komeilibacteria bacterium]|nr:hypothetical protein [Candidatus Komeilibacteria bacterium]
MLIDENKKLALFNELQKIINEADPIGLIYGEENKDEYDPEIKEIINKLDFNENEDSITHSIHNIFIEYFDKDIASNVDPYKLIAKKIKESEVINRVII